MKAIDRLFQYLDYKRIKPTRAEKDWGLSNGYLGKQKERNANLGEEKLLVIIDNCPDLSLEWLLAGKGEMLIKELPLSAGWKEFCEHLKSQNDDLANQLKEAKQKCNDLESIIFHGTPELRNAMIKAEGAKRLEALHEKMEERRKQWESETSVKAGRE